MRGIDLKSMKNDPDKLKKMANGVDPATMRQAQDALKQYQGKDENELVGELKRVAADGRMNGTLNNEKMESIANMIAPMLAPEQQEKMKTILAQLKQ